TPSAQAGGPLAILAANIYSHAYNEALKTDLYGLCDDKDFKGRIYLVNVYSEIVRAVAIVNSGRTYTPKFFVPGPPVAITNVTQEAIDYFNTYGIFPTNYLFWDDVHPTTQGHQVIAGLVLQALKKPFCKQSNSSSSSSS